MQCRVNLKSTPFGLTIMAASREEHTTLERIGHDGLVLVNIPGAESTGEETVECPICHAPKDPHGPCEVCDERKMD